MVCKKSILWTTYPLPLVNVVCERPLNVVFSLYFIVNICSVALGIQITIRLATSLYVNVPRHEFLFHRYLCKIYTGSHLYIFYSTRFNLYIYSNFLSNCIICVWCEIPMIWYTCGCRRYVILFDSYSLFKYFSLNWSWLVHKVTFTIATD